MAGSGVLSTRPGVRELTARRYLPLVAVAALATAVFSFRLGSSSFFLDEVYTWLVVGDDLAELRLRVVEQEVAPPLYYLLLHGWVLLTNADSEVALRLPSVAAGVALVAAVYWLGSLLGGRHAGLVGAGLAAVSPIVLFYAQQARSYVWVMLAVTVAVAAAIEAVRHRSTRWLVAAGAAGAAATLTHYTAAIVVAAVAGWMLMQESAFSLRARAAFAAALTVPLLALAPLIADQLSRGHQDWTAELARLDVDNALRLLGTPFDGRFSDTSLIVRQVGAAVAVLAVTILAFGDRLLGIRQRRLVAVAAFAPIALVFLISALVHPVALSRYTAVAAPFVLVAIGVVAVHVQRALGAVLVAAALVPSAIGVVGAARPEGQHPDLRETIATVAADWRKGDVVVGVSPLSYPDGLVYYAERMLPPEAHAIQSHPTIAAAVDAPRVVAAMRRRARIWFAADPPVVRSELGYALRRRGYRMRRQWVFDGTVKIQLVLAARGGA